MNNTYTSNRNKCLELMEDNTLMIVFSLRNDEDNFKVNRNFYFLTGLDEEADILVLEKRNGKMNSYIFIEPYDDFKALWVGNGLSSNEVTEFSGIKMVLYKDTFESELKKLELGMKKVYLDLSHPSFRQEKTYEESYEINLPKDDLTPILKTARTIKNEHEIESIKKAIAVTNEGVKGILDNIKPNMYEYQIESYFDQKIKFYGGDGFSFPTIAASGENACCLHYSENKAIMKDGDLILFDLGSTYDKYCADISRTFPVNGVFTDRQKQIYNIVLKAQEITFNFLRPGVTLKEAQAEVVKFYEKALMEIGLIKDPSEVKKYYYHSVSHHLGLDCHDLCDYTPLKEGSVVTVEPGLYIKEEGIGIRIEDDALITRDGCCNLSSEIIKTVEDIEAYIKNRK